jgi:hypothetical protein
LYGLPTIGSTVRFSTLSIRAANVICNGRDCLKLLACDRRPGLLAEYELVGVAAHAIAEPAREVHVLDAAGLLFRVRHHRGDEEQGGRSPRTPRHSQRLHPPQPPQGTQASTIHARDPEESDGKKQDRDCSDFDLPVADWEVHASGAKATGRLAGYRPPGTVLPQKG